MKFISEINDSYNSKLGSRIESYEINEGKNYWRAVVEDIWHYLSMSSINNERNYATSYGAELLQ